MCGSLKLNSFKEVSSIQVLESSIQKKKKKTLVSKPKRVSWTKEPQKPCKGVKRVQKHSKSMSMETYSVASCPCICPPKTNKNNKIS